MAQPLYFQPLEGVPDADVLGYGDLIFDDGSKQFVNGDEGVAATFGLPPLNDVSAQIDPMAPTAPSMGDDGQISSTPMARPPLQPIDDNNVVDPQNGHILSSNPEEVAQYLQQTAPPPAPPPQSHADPSLGLSRQEDLTNQLDQVSGTAPDPSKPVPIPGSQYQVTPATGEITPLGAGSSAPSSAPGMQPFSREGALPPGMYEQQASARETMNTNQMLALQSSRDAEANVYRTAALQRQGQLDAEKAAQDKAVAEQQAKVDRWKQEQTQTAAMDIKTDLVSAQGDVGAVFSILGAAMLGAVGSDAGLRMIDSAIDQNVKKQINMRDSKLHVLADQIGSTEQAIAAGKAQLYKIAGDKAETTEKLTKADAFQAQTASLVADLRQKQQLYEQEQQRISLGKTLEKAPVQAMPKPIDVEKYGKAAAEQRQGEQNIDRAANALGLAGWDPKSGTYKNREEILKNGIPGAGKLDAFLQGIPGLKNIDNAATSVEGQKVRASLEALVSAEAKQQNPGRAPTDADRDAARISLGLNTEEGIVAAIERLKSQQDQTKAQNAAAYGSAGAAYEGRIDAAGARPPQQHGDVDMGQPLQQGSARQQLQQERMRPREGLDAATREATGQGPQASADPIADVASEVQRVAGRELPPEGLKILVAQAAHETGDGQHAPNNNMFGHKATKGKASAAFETTEGEGSEAKRVMQNFRAYDSIAESVDDHIDLIRRKYPDAWAALERGDAPAFVAALKDGSYFTGSETSYLNGVLRRL